MRLSRLPAHCILALAVMGPGAALAQDLPVDLSATVTWTSDYIFRGITQNDGKPALQAGVTADHDSGAFVGLWGSEIDFGGDADYEIDVFAGFGNAVDLGFGELDYSAGAYYYWYPGENELNYLEVGLDLGYGLGPADLVGAVYYSPEVSDAIGGWWYLAGGTSVTIGGPVSLFGNVGWTICENSCGYDKDDEETVVDWNLGVALALDPVTVEVVYIDTDIPNRPGNELALDGSFVVNVTAAF